MATDAHLSTSSALLFIAVVATVGIASWFWSLRLQNTVYQTVSGKTLEPGSRRYRRIKRARWLSLGLSVAIILYTVAVWAGIARPD